MKKTAANLPRFYVLPISINCYGIFDRLAPKGRWNTGIEGETREEAEGLAAEMNDPHRS